MDPIISVLLPTRNRTALAHQSVDSLFSLSQDPTRVEVVLAYDEDDAQSHDYFHSQTWQDSVKNWRGHCQTLRCPNWGYQGLNHYYTAAARKALGQWLMIWNDDAVMHTPGWDQHVVDHRDFVGMLHMTTVNFKPSLTLFPLIPKLWLELFGQISLHQLNDSWIQDICHEADAVLRLPVSVFHDRYDVTGNNLDQTYQNRRYDKKIYHHEKMKQVRSEWAQRLRHHREHNSACASKPIQT